MTITNLQQLKELLLNGSNRAGLTPDACHEAWMLLCRTDLIEDDMLKSQLQDKTKLRVGSALQDAVDSLVAVAMDHGVDLD